MDALQFWQNITLPKEISDKLADSETFQILTSAMQQPNILKDFFYTNGFPKEPEKCPDTLFPCYAAHYLGYPVPRYYLEVNPLYSETSSVAAIKWLYKLLPAVGGSYVDIPNHLIGKTFTQVVNGKEFHFAFPIMRIVHHQDSALEQTAAIIPFPDTRENDDLWDNNGLVPYFVELQARMLMWCWHQVCFSKSSIHSPDDCPTRTYVVRITGNTPSDVKVYTVFSDYVQDDNIVQRICKAAEKAITAGRNPIDNLKVKDQPTWYERKEIENEYAFHSDDAQFRQLLADYMSARSERKTIEEKIANIQNAMDCIAISLASEIEDNSQSGSVVSGNTTYTVCHKKTRRKQTSTISADLLKQFCPDLYDDATLVSIYEKGRITVDVL